MNKKYTTSAQRTLTLPKDVILKKLEYELTKDRGLVFQAIKLKNIKEAKLKDGSKIVIASFDKPIGKTLAMIGHKNVPKIKDRSEVHSNIKKTLMNIFPEG